MCRVAIIEATEEFSFAHAEAGGNGQSAKIITRQTLL